VSTFITTSRAIPTELSLKKTGLAHAEFLKQCISKRRVPALLFNSLLNSSRSHFMMLHSSVVTALTVLEIVVVSYEP